MINFILTFFNSAYLSVPMLGTFKTSPLEAYAWPRFVDTLHKAMLLAHHKTGDKRYLDPILAALSDYDLYDKGE